MLLIKLIVSFGAAVLALAKNPPPIVSNPSQIHLALVPGNHAALRVNWASSESEAPIVKWGSDPSKMEHVATGNTTTYTIADMCGAPANETKWWVDPGLLHTAVMTGLTKGTDVYYQVGGTNGKMSGVQGPVHVGPRSRQVEDAALTFVAFGDLGVSSAASVASAGVAFNTSMLLQRLVNETDVIVHVGDISYAMGKAAFWPEFFAEIEPVAARVPWQVCIGNHEYDWPTQPFKPPLFTYAKDSGGECGVPYEKRFDMDREGPGGNIFYSFELGPVHFALISSEHNMTSGSEQLTWLARDLAAVDRARTPFVVFAMHRPLYDSTLYSLLPEATTMKDAIEPVLLANEVDVAMFGHVHQYSRSCPIAHGKCSPSGPVYMTIGTAGATNQMPFLFKPKHTMKQSKVHGAARYRVINETTLHVQYLAGASYPDETLTIDDDFYVVREKGGVGRKVIVV